MAALPGLILISFTKERTMALLSVNSLVFRNSLISVVKAAIAPALSRNCLRAPSSILASSAATSSFLQMRPRASATGLEFTAILLCYSAESGYGLVFPN